MPTEERLLLGSNLQVYYEIAKKAQSKSEKLDKRYTKPIPGQPGRFVHGYDPGRGSFKNALIAIVFSGVFADALIAVAALQEPELLAKQKTSFNKFFNKMNYEEKLKVLGVTDKILLENCKEFRDSRNDVVHDKPNVFVGGKLVSRARKPRVAQVEAARAVKFIDRLWVALKKRS
jgi:hypothetical protein